MTAASSVVAASVGDGVGGGVGGGVTAAGCSKNPSSAQAVGFSSVVAVDFASVVAVGFSLVVAVGFSSASARTELKDGFCGSSLQPLDVSPLSGTAAHPMA
jgi:hypothetical protein